MLSIGNRHSPRALFRAILKDHLEARNESFLDYCYIIPIQGIGDRLAFLSLLSHLRVARRKICLLYRGSDGLSFLYSGLADLSIDIGNLVLDPWIYGDETVGEGNLFFTWHVLYGNGLYQEKSGCMPGIFDNVRGGHKRAVRMSLGLSLDLKCGGFDFQASGEGTVSQNPYLLISPIANSSDSLVGEALQRIIEIVTKAEMQIVINVGNGGAVDERYSDISGVSFFSGSLADLVSVAKRAEMCINIRSGISELCSAIGVRYADIYIGDLVRHMQFWSLTEGFLMPPIFESNGLVSFEKDFNSYLWA